MELAVSVYCIEDCYANNYVGSTHKKLSDRLTQHKYTKQSSNRYCSSSKLDLNNSEIWLLEKCSEKNRREREQHYIDTIECVNEIGAIPDKEKWKINHLKHMKKRYNNNKEKFKKYQRDRYSNNKKKLQKYQEKYKESSKKHYEYKRSWGLYNNNLLSISTDIFN